MISIVVRDELEKEVFIEKKRLILIYSICLKNNRIKEKIFSKPKL